MKNIAGIAKQSFTAVCLVLTGLSAYAQLEGGKDFGQPNVHRVEKSTLSSGMVQDNVNLFNGSFSSSVTLGTVSTPGLSYTATMSYNSSVQLGNNEEFMSGIPYGEGWQVDIPKVTIEFTPQSWDFYKDLFQFDPLCSTPLPGGVMPTGWNAKRRRDWFNPVLSIPGVFSGKLIFKFNDENGFPVFVPERFEEYIEAKLKFTTNSWLQYGFGSSDSRIIEEKLGPEGYKLVYWEVTLKDGTIYEFKLPVYRQYNGNNYRLSSFNSDQSLRRNIVPSTETPLWYITRIYKKSEIHQYIDFDYLRYGNYFISGEHQQYHLARGLANTYLSDYDERYLSTSEIDMLLNYFTYFITGFYKANKIGDNLNGPVYDSPRNGMLTQSFFFYKEVFPKAVVAYLGNGKEDMEYQDDLWTESPNASSLRDSTVIDLGLEQHERLDFEYKSRSITSADNTSTAPYSNLNFQVNSTILSLGQPGVSALDDLYLMKSIYYWGKYQDGPIVGGIHSPVASDSFFVKPTSTNNFNINSSSSDRNTKWRRIKNLRHSSFISNNNIACDYIYQSNGLPHPSNPYALYYVQSQSGYLYHSEEDLSNSEVINASFDHSFLQSPDISGNLIPGDDYQIRSMIFAPRRSSDGSHDPSYFGSFDFDVATDVQRSNNQLMKVDSRSLFSTFNNPIKWSPWLSALNTYGPPTDNKNGMVTVNTFTLGNYKTSVNQPVFIRVGPANSDHNFNFLKFDYGTKGFEENLNQLPIYQPNSINSIPPGHPYFNYSTNNSYTGITPNSNALLFEEKFSSFLTFFNESNITQIIPSYTKPYEPMTKKNEAILVGFHRKFDKIEITNLAGSASTPPYPYMYVNRKMQYYRGATATWEDLTTSTPTTLNELKGVIQFTVPTDWVMKEVRGYDRFWIRIVVDVEDNVKWKWPTPLLPSQLRLLREGEITSVKVKISSMPNADPVSHNVRQPGDIANTIQPYPTALFSYFQHTNHFVINSQSSPSCSKPQFLHPLRNTPNNFGAGLPWFMMLDLYHKIYTGSYEEGNTEVLDKRSLPFLSNWWSYKKINNSSSPCNSDTPWPNRPTLATEDTRLDRLQLLRISRNTYMLSSVKKYVRHGLVSNSQYKVGYSPGMVIVEHKNFNYRPVSIPVYLNARPASLTAPCSSTKTFVYNRHTMLLTGIENKDIISNTSEKAYSFNYASFPLQLTNGSISNWKADPSKVFQCYHNVLSEPILLTGYTNPLGATKTITYYPITDSMVRYISYTDGFRSAYRNNMTNTNNNEPLSNIIVYLNPMVKEVIETSIQGKSILRTYEFSRFFRRNTQLFSNTQLLEATLPGTLYHVMAEKNGSPNNYEYGFEIARVKSFHLTGQTSPSTVFLGEQMYAHETNWHLFGKVKFINTYGQNLLRTSRKSFDWNWQQAYSGVQARIGSGRVDTIANKGEYSGFHLSTQPDFCNREPYNNTEIGGRSSDYIDFITGVRDFDKAEATRYTGSFNLNLTTFPITFIKRRDTASYFISLQKSVVTEYQYAPVSFPGTTSPANHLIRDMDNWIDIQTVNNAHLYGNVPIANNLQYPFSNLMSATPITIRILQEVEERRYYTADRTGRSNNKEYKRLLFGDYMYKVVPSFNKLLNYQEYENFIKSTTEIGLSQAYVINRGNSNNPEIVSFEPSWNVSNIRTFSPQRPNENKEQSFFYYYDLQKVLVKPDGNFPNLSKFPDGKNGYFAASFFYKNGARGIPYRIDHFTGNNDKLIDRKTEFFEYDTFMLSYKQYKASLLDTALGATYLRKFYEYFPPCSLNNLYSMMSDLFIKEMLTNVHIPSCFYNKDYFDNLLGQRNSSNGQSLSVTASSEARVENNSASREHYFPDYFSKRVVFKSHFVSIDTTHPPILSNPNALNGGSLELFVLPNIVGTNEVLRTIWDFKMPVVRQLMIHKRNYYGSPEVVENANGLYTRYIYNYPMVRQIRDGSQPRCATNSYLLPGQNPNKVIDFWASYMYHPHLPSMKIEDVAISATEGGYRKFDPTLSSRYTYYEYNSRNLLTSIKEHNGSKIIYDYDGLNRLITVIEDMEVKKTYTYSNWKPTQSNNNYLGKLNSNYIDELVFTNSYEGNMSRSYIDPSGKPIHSVSNTFEYGPSRNLIFGLNSKHSGEVKFDHFDRPSKQFKHFSRTITDPSQALALTYNSSNSAFPQQTSEIKYSNDEFSRTLETADFGIALGSTNTVDNSYTMISGPNLVSDCSLTSQEAAELMPSYVFGQASQSVEYMFRKTSTNDQDGKQVDSYQDALGRVVAQRSTISTNNHAITLFIYNPSDQLVKVIDPRKLATTYRYNLNGLVIEKCSPDEGCKHYMYDASGRVVVEQDAMLKTSFASGEGYRLYHYDKFGSLFKQERRVLYNTTDIPFSNYSGVSFRRSNTFRFQEFSNYKKFGDLEGTANSSIIPEKEWVYYGPNMTTPIYLHSKARSFFRDRSYRWGRLAHTLSFNHYGKAVQLEIYNYNSKGQVKDFVVQTNLRGMEEPQPGSVHLIRNTYSYTGQLDKQEIDINMDCRLDFYTRYIYDRYDRLKEVYAGHQSNAANPYKIASYQYRDQDDLLSKASYHQNNQLINDAFYYYDANRDRLTRMDDAHLTWDLFYDNTMPAGVTGIAPNYNGNINATKSLYKWTAAGLGVVGRTYRYQYDDMNRLTFAGTDQAANGVNGDETFVYDKSGNFFSISRVTNSGNRTVNYAYVSNTNRLGSTSIGSQLDKSMEYDHNGNMTQNGRVGLDYKLFKYGQSNLPYAYYRDIPPTNGGHTNEDSLWLLYGVNDLRIGLYQPNHTYLDAGISHYLRDHTGRELAMNKQNADGTNSKWTYYLFGHGGQRIASYTPDVFRQPDANFYQGIALGGNTDPHMVTAEAYPLTTTGPHDYWIGAAGALEVGRLRVPTNLLGSTYFTYQTSPDLNTKHHLRMVSNDHIELREGATIGGLEAESRVSIFTLDPGAFCTTFDNTDMPGMKYHTYDHLGSLRVTYRRSGASLPVDALYEYSPYGRVVQTYQAAGRDRYLSTGHEREEATNYDYRLARLYDAELGRFLGVDALAGKFPGWSSYNYVFANPIRFVDPDGRRPFPVNDYYLAERFRIDSWFGPRNTGLKYASRVHKGLDFNFGAGKFDYGAPVLSTHDGIVTIKDDMSGNTGRMVTVTSPDGSFRTKYMHLKSINVKEGQEINESTQIGEIGGSRSGKEQGGLVHLHYQIEKLNKVSKIWEHYNPTEEKGNSKENVVDPQTWINAKAEDNMRDSKLIEQDNTRMEMLAPMIRKEP